jgi:hypothetical protein
MRQGDSRYTRSGLAGGELPPTNKLSDRASKEVKIDIHNRQPYEWFLSIWGVHQIFELVVAKQN